MFEKELKEAYEEGNKDQYWSILGKRGFPDDLSYEEPITEKWYQKKYSK